ncbi:MAG: acetyltransferase [Lachnospiraceae bacterium]|nr:acetyltransferase [Lachnospiraceae bacterium]
MEVARHYRLIIIGASGHGKVVADIAKFSGYKEIVFLDDNESVKECSEWLVVGKSNEAPEGDIFIAIGSAATRKKLMELYANRNQPVLIHPSAIIATDVKIGAGTVIMAGAVVNPGARIGRGVIVNTSSSIDHDCQIGDYCHVSVGAHLCGTVKVGTMTWIGAGATVSNNVDICENSTIGAGTVVIKSINEPGTYVGVPARMKD